MRARTTFRSVAAALVLALAACGDDDSSEASSEEAEDAGDPGDTSDTGGTDESDDSDESADTGDSTSSAGATASVGDASYEFPDVVECEIDGETWGEGWRSLVAWSADGHDLLRVTVGNEESESLGLRRRSTSSSGRRTRTRWTRPTPTRSGVTSSATAPA